METEARCSGIGWSSSTPKVRPDRASGILRNLPECGEKEGVSVQRAVANRRLGASGTRAVTRPTHLGPTTIGNHVIHRLIQTESLSGDSSEFSPSYPPVSELLNEVLGGPRPIRSGTRSYSVPGSFRLARSKEGACLPMNWRTLCSRQPGRQ